MNILVCVKQVPDTTEITIDPVTKTLNRAGVPAIVNPFDAYALEMAVRLTEELNDGSQITILSMGPDQAKAAIKECIACGAHEGYLLSDRAFAGSDTLATSNVLATAIKTIEEQKGEKFDIIFCGKQAIDGDTGQVGPEMAEHLGYAQITYVSGMELDGDTIKVKRENDEGYDFITSQLPLIVTVVKTPYEPRFPSIKSKMAANKKEIPVLTGADIKIDPETCGLKGSPTKVVKSFTPVRDKKVTAIKEETPELAAQVLIQYLSDEKIL